MMRAVRALQHVTICAGVRLRLTEPQAHARAHALRADGDGEFVSLAALQFKAGEDFWIADADLSCIGTAQRDRMCVFADAPKAEPAMTSEPDLLQSEAPGFRQRKKGRG